MNLTKPHRQASDGSADYKQHKRRRLRYRLNAANERIQERLNIGVAHAIVVIQIADREQVGRC
jgi:hypothetical protein